MSKRRKAYTLTQKELVELGFTDCYFDEARNKWIVKRFWRAGIKPEKVDKEIEVSFTNNKHPYGDDQSAPVISFSANNKIYSISFPRFVWAWTYGKISFKEKVKTNNSIKLEDWELTNLWDHSYYKKANTYTVVREMLEGKRPVKYK